MNPFDKIKADLQANRLKAQFKAAHPHIVFPATKGPVVELVDTADLKSAPVKDAGSIPAGATIQVVQAVIDGEPSKEFGFFVSHEENRLVAAVKSLAHTMRVKLYGLWASVAYKHPLDTMSPERYKELMGDTTLQLTQQEVDKGYVFCCEWDNLLIHAAHPEADCCGCLREFRKENGIKDGDWRDK